ncbi:MAG: aldehyde dehydrogenase family protein, partial [Acidobacteria bacterium]|nr:aldehyde dehydrogenase family protein [Acidobacteriota bacterium]
DLLGQARAREALASFRCSDLIAICRRAADHFAADSLPLGDGHQSPAEYVEQVSATTGLPHALAGRNMAKIESVLRNMESILAGLSRGLDLRILDNGLGSAGQQALSYFPQGDSLGVVLPSNSPGVHSLWIPAFALKTPLILKPGSGEPWTPYRIVQALMRAGAPGEAFGFYPADHAGAAEILRHSGRGMVFGDAASTRIWKDDPRIELHGPGYSKIVLGEDAVDQWERYLEVMVRSIADNSGRSCVNASGVWVPRKSAEIAEALADRLARILPRDADDPEAQLAPFADPAIAARISNIIDASLAEPGAREVTAAHRGGGRLAIHRGCSYLLPTVVHCGPDHPLANREFLFPFASVVEIDPAQIPERLGGTLVLTAITEDAKVKRRLLSSSLVGRLNLGPIPTNQISWDQPHEGNLFDHLYARRAIQPA